MGSGPDHASRPVVRKPQPAFRTILAESVLRTPLHDAREWRQQLKHLAEAADRPNITVQVIPHDVGMHALKYTDVMFPRLTDGRTVAYIENDVRGELIEAASRVEELQRRYDRVRDLTLSPEDSRTFFNQRLGKRSATHRPQQRHLAS